MEPEEVDMATKAKVEFQQYFELFKEVWKKPRLTNLETKLTWTHKGDFTIQSIRGGGKGNRDNIQQLLVLASSKNIPFHKYNDHWWRRYHLSQK